MKILIDYPEDFIVKRFFLLLCIMIIGMASVSALSKPRWSVRPIKVYIPGTTYNSQIMKNAFLQWQTRTNSAVWFNFVSDNKKGEEDITVHFVESDTKCGSPYAIGCAKSRIDPDGFYSHVDIYIASKIVYTLKGDDGTIAKKTTLISAPQIYRVMLHEIGHAIGIHEHSKNPNSIMYAYSLDDVNIPQRLTDDDLTFVYKVYR